MFLTGAIMGFIVGTIFGAVSLALFAINADRKRMASG